MRSKYMKASGPIGERLSASDADNERTIEEGGILDLTSELSRPGFHSVPPINARSSSPVRCRRQRQGNHDKDKSAWPEFGIG
jgi:hypothetical protein